MHGVAPSTLCPYKGTLPHPRHNEGRTQSGTDWHSSCIVPPLLLFNQLKASDFIPWETDVDMFWQKTCPPSKPKQDYAPAASATCRPVLAPPGCQSISSLFNNSCRHACVQVLIPRCIHQLPGFLLFLKVRSNWRSHQLTHVGASLYVDLKAGNARLCLPLHPLLLTPTIRRVPFKTQKLNRKA